MKKILSIIIIIVLSTILGLAYNASTNLSLRLLEATDDIRPFREDFNYNFELVDDIFDDVTLTEFSYLDGVTSSIQTQIDSVGSGAVDTSGTPVDNDIAVFTDLNTIEGLNYAELKAVLDLEIGTDLQAWDAQLDDISALAYANGNFIVGDGSNWVAESGATARASLGLTIGTNVQAYDAGLLSIAGLTTSANDMIYTTALDTYAIMDTFSELQAVVADKTLINEEDAIILDNNLAFEGTANDYETTFTITDPTADRAITFQDAAGIVVMDATACTDIEGLGLTIDTGTLKFDYTDVSDEIAGDIAEGELADSIIVSADIKDGVIAEADLKIVDSPTDEDVFTYESTTGDFEWHSKAELGIGTATSITDGLILEVDLNADEEPADNDILTFDTTDDNFSWQTLAELGIAATGQTFYIGTTQVSINRSSGALTLAGLTLTTPDIGTPSAGTLTNCSFPTLNQNTTGSAATLTTARNIGGVAFDGSANIAPNIITDTTPELGGELDAGAHSIGFTLQTATGDGTTTIDWKLGNKFEFTFGSQNDTFTFTAPTNPGNFMLWLIQDGTGSRTITWPGTVRWPGGTAPTLSTAAAAVDIVSLVWNGTNYDCVSGLAFAVP